MESQLPATIEDLEQYNIDIDYDIISLNEANPCIHSPKSPIDIFFYQTKETLMDPEVYRSFLKNAESRFRRSPEYKTYKGYLMSLGMDHCQIMGNIEASETVDIELHHNILNLFDICILICEAVLNTVGYISTFDLIQLLIKEHYENRIPIVMLSTTAHQMYTNGGQESYIPPEYVYGRWWELISKYKWGLTYQISEKIITYINRYQTKLPNSINLMPQEQILNYSYYNEQGFTAEQIEKMWSMENHTTRLEGESDD